MAKTFIFTGLIARIIKLGFKSIYYFALAIASILFILFLYLFFWDNIDPAICIESGKVWDSAQKKCRDDCRTWNEIEGCVPLDGTIEQQQENNLDEKDLLIYSTGTGIHDCNIWDQKEGCFTLYWAED